jgi:hypothetical protein
MIKLDYVRDKIVKPPYWKEPVFYTNRTFNVMKKMGKIHNINRVIMWSIKWNKIPTF